MGKASVIVLTSGDRLLTYDDLEGCFSGREALQIMGLELVPQVQISKELLSDDVTRSFYGEDMPKEEYDKNAYHLVIPVRNIAFIRDAI